MARKRRRRGPVLVPVDFSQDSRRAVEWAASAARAFGASLLIAHVVHDPAAAPGYYARVKKQRKHLGRLEDAAQEMMAEFLAEMRVQCAELAYVEVETRLVVGLPVGRILELAADCSASLIVMGSRGRTGLPHLLVGSKSLKVAQLSPVPVTIVKQTCDLARGDR